jgi:hypothetical protein
MTFSTLTNRSNVRFAWTNSFADRYTLAPLYPEQGALLSLRQLRTRFGEVARLNNSNEWGCAIAVKTSHGWARVTAPSVRDIVRELDHHDGMAEYDHDNGRARRILQITVRLD